MQYFSHHSLTYQNPMIKDYQGYYLDHHQIHSNCFHLDDDYSFQIVTRLFLKLCICERFDFLKQKQQQQQQQQQHAEGKSRSTEYVKQQQIQKKLTDKLKQCVNNGTNNNNNCNTNTNCNNMSNKQRVRADPLTPEQAIKLYHSKLTKFEQNEILNYANVYYVGDNAKKVNAVPGTSHNNGFDDKNGRYKLFQYDHIQYRLVFKLNFSFLSFIIAKKM